MKRKLIFMFALTIVSLLSTDQKVYASLDQLDIGTNTLEQIQGSDDIEYQNNVFVTLLEPQKYIVETPDLQRYQFNLKPGQKEYLVFSASHNPVGDNQTEYVFGGSTEIEVSFRGETTLPNLNLGDTKRTFLQNTRVAPNFTSFFPKQFGNIVVEKKEKMIRVPLKIPANISSGTFTGNLIIHTKDLKQSGLFDIEDQDQKIPISIIVDGELKEKLHPIQIKPMIYKSYDYDDGFLQVVNVHGLEFKAVNQNSTNLQQVRFTYQIYQKGRLVTESTQLGQGIAANETFKFVPNIPYLKPGRYRLKIQMNSLQGQLGSQWLGIKIPDSKSSTVVFNNLMQFILLSSSIIFIIIGGFSGVYWIVYKKRSR